MRCQMGHNPPELIVGETINGPEKFNLDPTIMDSIKTHPIAFIKNIDFYFVALPQDQLNLLIAYISHAVFELLPYLMTLTPGPNCSTFVKTDENVEGTERPLCPMLHLALKSVILKDRFTFSRQDWNDIMWKPIIAALTAASHDGHKHLLNCRDTSHIME